MKFALLLALALLFGATACVTPDILPGLSVGVEYERDTNAGSVGFDFNLCELTKAIELPGVFGTAFGFVTNFLDCDTPAPAVSNIQPLPNPATMALAPIVAPVDPDDFGS